MKKLNYARIAVLVLSLALLIGAAFSISAAAEEKVSTGKFGSLSLAYGDNVAIQVVVDATEAEIKSGDVRVTYALNDETKNATYYRTDDSGRVWVITDGIAIYNLAQPVTFNSYVGNVQVEENRTCSAAQFIYYRLYVDTDTTDAYKALYKELLEYGAAAQTALNKNTDALVTASTIVIAGENITINGKDYVFTSAASLEVTPVWGGTIPAGQCHTGWKIMKDNAEDKVAPSFECSGAVKVIEPVFSSHLDENADEVCDNCGGEFIVVKYNVTLNYGTHSKTVEVKGGDALTEADLAIDSKYPFAVTGWLKDGVAYDVNSAVTEEMTLTAVLANEYVYDDFETEGTWNTSASATYTHITAGAINGQSLQFTTTGNYQAINRQNLTDKIDFTDVNYIFVKVRASSNVRITFRFVNTNAFSGTQVQIGYDVKADGGWHTICIDMNSIFTADAAFGKDAIKSFVIMSGTAATVAIDDIVFVNDKSLYKQDVIKHYDFECQGSWSATGSGNTATYVTEDAINNQSLKGTLTAWNGLVNQNAAGLFADTNYVYLKIKGVSANPYIRLYKSIGISNDYYTLIGTTVATVGDYRILRYDISDWSKLTVKGAANFTKSEVNTLFFGSLASAATFVVDDIILSASELSFE